MAFQPSTTALLPVRPNVATGLAAIVAPASVCIAAEPFVPENLRHNFLWRAIQADLDNAVETRPNLMFERLLRSQSRGRSACIVWHNEIGPAGMTLRLAGAAEDDGSERGTPLDSADPLLAMQVLRY